MKHLKLYSCQVMQVIQTSDLNSASDPPKYTVNIRSVQGTLSLPHSIGDNILIVKVTTERVLHMPCCLCHYKMN